jgi:tetratricopeptide (TPR) repeat protein
MQSRLFFNIKLTNLKTRLLQSTLCFFFFVLPVHVVHSQSNSKLYEMACKELDKGNFTKAENYLLAILGNQEKKSEEMLASVFIVMANINSSLGKNDQAVEYYVKGEKMVLESKSSMKYLLPSIYNNLGIIFKYQGDYEKAVDYYNESLHSLENPEIETKFRNGWLAQILNNLGLVLYLKKQYPLANTHFEKSIDCRKKNHLEGLDIVYNNYASSLRELHKFELATKYYDKCIEIRLNKYGPKFYRLAYVYADKGKLECSKGDLKAGLALYQKALDILLASYGRKHPYTAEICQIIGDFYSDQKNFEKALFYYQQSLIANAVHFNSTDLKQNPSADNGYSEIQMLRSLKKKSDALLAQANQSGTMAIKISGLELCIQTIELGVCALQQVRQGYLSVESKLFITKSEKEFFMNGLDCALQLYELTGVESNVEKAYYFSRESKAAVLLNEIKQNEAFLSILPDSLKKQKDEIVQNLASLKKLLFDENNKLKPDQQKIAAWQSQIFI